MRAGERNRGRGRAARLWLLACLIALAGALAMPAASAAASKWALRTLPPQPVQVGSGTHQVVLSGVSCPSESLCVAVGALDTVAFSMSPTGGADRWHVVNPTFDEPRQRCLEEQQPEVSCYRPKGAIGAVSCATESLCVAVGYEGSVYASTEPTGGASAWSVTDVNEGRNATHLTSVSCPSPALCVAVSGGYGEAAGTVLTSTAPASGRWQATQLDGAPDLRGVSCATISLCVAVAKEGRVFISSDPTGGPSAWRATGSPTPRDLFAVSCVATILCTAGDAGGNLLTSTDPIGGSGFAETNPTGSVQITGVSCPTTRRCVTVTNNADILTSTDPTGGTGSWTFENLVPFEVDRTGAGIFVKNALFGVSCATTSLCVTVGANSRIFTATDPFAAPAPSRSRAAGKGIRRRPRAILVFAEGFWKFTTTRRHRVNARFRFYSRDGARGFLCKPDRRRWRRCHSPLRYWASIGRHVLRVRAIGRTGLHGPVTSLRFEVRHPPRRR